MHDIFNKHIVNNKTSREDIHRFYRFCHDTKSFVNVHIYKLPARVHELQLHNEQLNTRKLFLHSVICENSPPESLAVVYCTMLADNITDQNITHVLHLKTTLHYL